MVESICTEHLSALPQSIVQQLAVMTEAASEGGAGGLEPEVDAAALRVRRLLRAKLEELKAVPLRGGGGGAGRPYNRASESSSGVHAMCRPSDLSYRL